MKERGAAWEACRNSLPLTCFYQLDAWFMPYIHAWLKSELSDPFLIILTIKPLGLTFA